MASNTYLLYRMTANLTYPPYSVVSWFSANQPDYTGANSGYPTNLLANIAIDGQPQSLTNPNANYNIPSGPASGDLSGLYPAPEVVGIDGYPISGTAPQNGYVLTFNDNQLSWTNIPAPIDVAGGDLSGTYPNPEVTGLLSHTLPSLTSGYLNWTGSAWALTAGGTLFAPGADLSGNGTSTTTNQYVSSLSYSSSSAGGAITINGTSSSLTFAANNTAPTFTQETPTSDAATYDLTIQSQATYSDASSHTLPGNINLNVPIGNTGTTGWVNVKIAGTKVAAIGSVLNDNANGVIYLSSAASSPGDTNWTLYSYNNLMALNAGTDGYLSNAGNSTLHWQSNNFNFTNGISNPTFGQDAISTGNGINLTIAAQSTTGASSTGGNLILAAGSGTSSPGSIEFTSGANYWNISGNSFVATTNATGSLSPIIGHNATSIGNGANFIIQAQNSTAASSTGGNLIFSPGVGTVTDGYVAIGFGAEENIVPTWTFSGSTIGQLSISSTTTNPEILQATTTVNSTTGQNLTIAAQSASGTSSIGGSLLLQAGTGTTEPGSILFSSGANYWNISANAFVATTTASGANAPIIGQNATNSGNGNTFTFQAQNTIAAASVGGNLVLTSGTGTVNGSAAASENAGELQLQAGTNLIMGMDGYGHYIASDTVTIATSGPTTLSAVQVLCPYLSINTVTLAGNATLQFPGTVASGTCRTWYVNVANITFSSHTLTLQIGTGSTAVVVSAVPTGDVIVLLAPSNNFMYSVN
jgi:hypothetical protein